MESMAVDHKKKQVNCDQVAWLMNALERLAQMNERHFPAVSRIREAAKLATLLEIMEILGYEFQENAAAGNALSSFREFHELIKGAK